MGTLEGLSAQLEEGFRRMEVRMARREQRLKDLEEVVTKLRAKRSSKDRELPASCDKDAEIAFLRQQLSAWETSKSHQAGSDAGSSPDRSPWQLPSPKPVRQYKQPKPSAPDLSSSAIQDLDVRDRGEPREVEKLESIVLDPSETTDGDSDVRDVVYLDSDQDWRHWGRPPTTQLTLQCASDVKAGWKASRATCGVTRSAVVEMPLSAVFLAPDMSDAQSGIMFPRDGPAGGEGKKSGRLPRVGGLLISVERQTVSDPEGTTTKSHSSTLGISMDQPEVNWIDLPFEKPLGRRSQLSTPSEVTSVERIWRTQIGADATASGRNHTGYLQLPLGTTRVVMVPERLAADEQILQKPVREISEDPWDPGGTDSTVLFRDTGSHAPDHDPGRRLPLAKAEETCWLMELPVTLSEYVRGEQEATLTGEHFDVEQTLDVLKERFYVVEAGASGGRSRGYCDVSTTEIRLSLWLQDHLKFVLAGESLERIAFGFLGFLPIRSRGNRYLILLPDYSPERREATTNPAQTTVAVTRMLMRRVLRFSIELQGRCPRIDAPGLPEGDRRSARMGWTHGEARKRYVQEPRHSEDWNHLGQRMLTFPCESAEWLHNPQRRWERFPELRSADESEDLGRASVSPITTFASRRVVVTRWFPDRLTPDRIKVGRDGLL